MSTVGGSGSGGNKPRTFQTFETVYEYESYLTVVSIPKYQIALTKLRTSCHCLEIEVGRYHKPTSTPPDLRLCTVCEEAENEVHFVCDCLRYQALREDLYSVVSTDIPEFIHCHLQRDFPQSCDLLTQKL